MTMAIRLPSFYVADPNEVLRPVNPAFIAITLVIALLLNLLPISGTALMVRPDFLAVVLLYWCIQAPRYVGVGIAWFMGLLMDVGDGHDTPLRAGVSALGLSYVAGIQANTSVWAPGSVPLAVSTTTSSPTLSGRSSTSL